MKKALVLGLLLGTFSPLSAIGDDTLVKFRGGIGVDPVSSVTVTPTDTTVNRNVVRGISPPGQVWRIAELTADVRLDGRIRVGGRGLLLAGGNAIGTNAGQSVFATLLCGALPAGPFTLHSSGTVALEPNGDFRIDDLLSPTPENPCNNPVLLIRNVAGAWFAAGILRLDD